MSDKQGAAKTKVTQEKSERNHDKSDRSVSENYRSNLKETSAREVQSKTETEIKSKTYEKKEYPKYPIKGKSPTKNGTFMKPRREEDRNYNANAKSTRRPVDSKFMGASSVGSASPSIAHQDKKQTDPNKTFSDETRLSKLMRRVLRDSDKERRINATKQLKDFIHSAEGAKTAQKAADDVLAALQSVLFERTCGDVKQEVALCIGVVGSTMVQDMQSYFTWIFTQIETVMDDETKGLYLLALAETLKCDEKKQNAADLMDMVMEKVQTMLENADTPELLISVVGAIQYIAKKHPHVFNIHFRDTVDILVGWHIDATQKEDLIKYVSMALVTFHPFWTNNLQFSLTLLGQFLEDMEAYAEDLNVTNHHGSGEEEALMIQECITKISALLRVFTTVIQSLGESFSPTKGHNSKEYVCEVMEKIVRIVDTSTKYVYSEHVLIAGNTCLSMLLTHLQMSVISVCDVLLPFIIMQVTLTRLMPKQLLLSVFSFIVKIVESFDIHLPVSFISQLMAPGSVIQTSRFSHSGEVLNQLMQVYHNILGLKSVSLLEEAYRLILCDIQVAYNTVLCDGDSRSVLELVKETDNTFREVKYSKRQAETTFIFNICALSELANTKSNVIGMWALSPSVFDLLSQRLQLTNLWIAQCYPAIQYSIVQALYSHCCRHGNFVSSSSLLTSAVAPDSPSMSTMSQLTRSHFTQVLHLTEQLLSETKVSYDVRCLVLKWISEIIVNLQTTPHVYMSSAFLSLMQALVQQGFHHEQPVFIAASQCLTSLFKTTLAFPKRIVKICLEVCAFRLTDTRRVVREAYGNLLKLLPLDGVASSSLVFEAEEDGLASQRRDKAAGMKMAWLARRNHIGKPSMGTFHSHNFRHVMAFILNGTPPSQNGCFHWLEAMFHSCQRSEKDVDKSLDTVTLSDVIDGNQSLLWFWTTWESAQFCVLARLRTPLGKPQETFMTIESVLKSFASEVKGHSESEDDPSTPENTKRDDKPGEYSTLRRIHLLLQFMEHLEKLLYNAYEGCAVAMPVYPKTVRTFFRTNRNTCQEWLARIRMCVVKIAVQAGIYPVAVRHAFELLKEMHENDATQGPEFEQAVVLLVQSLTQLRSPESIMGIYNWCRDTAGHKLPWVKAAAEKAHRRYEVAAREFKSLLRLTVDEEDDRLMSDSSSCSSSEGSPSPDNRHVRKSALGKLGVDKSAATVSFIANEVTDCYMQLSDWTSVIEWQEALHTYRTENPLNSIHKAFSTSVDLNYIKALSHFDSGELNGVRDCLELVPGASLSESSKYESVSSPSWNPHLETEHIHRQFIRAATILQEQKAVNYRSDVMRYLSQAERLGEGLLRINTLDWPPSLSSQVLTELSTVSTLHKQLDEKKARTVLLPLSDQLLVDAEDQEIGMYLQTLRLINLQMLIPGCDKKTDLNNQMLLTLLAAASLSRKQQNFELAEDLLIKQVTTLMKNHVENGWINAPNDLVPALSSLRAANGGIDQYDVLKIERESAKLLHDISQYKDSIEVLSNSIVSSLLLGDLHKVKKTSATGCGELCAQSLVTLVKWLQTDQKLLGNITSQVRQTGQGDGAGASSIVRNLKLLLESEEKGAKKGFGITLDDKDQVLKIGENPNLSDSDSIVGCLLHLATMQCPSMSKSWFVLSGWCYKWGRKAVDNASHGSVELLAGEKTQIKSIIPKGVGQEEIERVFTVLSQIHSPLSSEEDISDQDQSLYDDGTETTRKQLISSCLCLHNASNDCIDQLLGVWQGVVRRVYHYYQLSAQAYFTFLQLNGKGEECDSSDSNIIATLRLLRLLVKHAWELRDVLETGLAKTPTTPWKGIIPQLFSRLSHPESYVRQSVSDLLCRVAHDVPHLIVYPAVVGSSTTVMEAKVSNQSGLLRDYLSQGAEDLDEEGVSQIDDEAEDGNLDDHGSTMLQTCLMSIVDTLSQENPKMISEVQQMVQELRRITLLWDELWLGTLNQQHADVMRAIAQLDNEVKKVNNNSLLSKEDKIAIIREKHRTVMKPTVYTIERLHEITSQPAETPHEKWFQTTYGQLIENALERLLNPSNPSHPHASWQLFKQIHLSLQQRAQKRNSLHLKMEDISPRLAELRASVIPMPGLGVSGQTVTIESVSSSAQILPTKTKPKKLVLIGSDGRRHPYLFKGLEDLHLDERIMQFLSIVNNMFTTASKGNRQLYKARHYSVTPLGPRSGLIQWVEGATPLFGLYKKWQQREAVAQALKQLSAGTSSQGSTAPPNQPNIPRPSEVYYSKLTPALKEKGIETLDNRKEWPLSVLIKVLKELISETPNDLLARELWCASSGASEWWQITQNYARSTAVMSMIGYIIGLGDRHLDNVLVDLATGEVVHIDYNVCFEKGKSLRVPERVPFRMTQNLEAALGVTGVEGTFRTACEHVIKTMRKGRETLLTLLEAFVYDPLVDWTTGNEGGYTGAFYGGGMTVSLAPGDKRKSKKEMEREITRSMFMIRVAEMKTAWVKNKDEILTAIPQLTEGVTAWLQSSEHLVSHLTSIDSYKSLEGMLKEAVAQPSHHLYSLQARYNEYSVVKATKDTAQSAVEEKINEFSNWQKRHQIVIETIQGHAFQQLCLDIGKPLDLGSASFSAATDFLHGAGQGQIVTQCEQLEAEMSSYIQQRRALLRNTVEILHSYSTIVTQFGSIFANDTRTSQYLQWLQELICDFTTDKCNEIVSRCHEKYGGLKPQSTKVQAILNTESRLQTIITDVNGKLIKLLERRSQDTVETTLLEKQLHEAEASIHNFINENGTSGVSSLTCVIVSALCSLNKRYIMMEGAAAGAGDRLLDLTSRDGDWFLDELCSVSGNVNMFLDTLKHNTQAGDIINFCELHHALNSTNNAYLALQDLHLNFRNIILPEALKLIQSQEPSLLNALSDLESMIGEVMQPLDSLIGQVDVLHRNAVMGIENESSEVIAMVHKMQSHFSRMLQGPDPECSSLSPGQMLLMGFNGLFTRLEDEFTHLLEAMDAVQIPDAWKKVDAVREAKAMQLSPFTLNTRGMLNALFFLKRIQAMQDFFHMVTQFAAALQGLDGGMSFDDEQMAKPVKRFIAEYVRKQMIGFPSQILGYILCVFIDMLGLNVTAEIELKDVGAQSKVPMDDLCKKAVDHCLRTNQFQHHQLTQATSLMGLLDTGWRKHDLASRLDSNISMMKTCLQRNQPQVARFQWLHEDLFVQAGRHHNQFVTPNRATVMPEMRKATQNLLNQDGGLASCQEHYTQQEISVAQRLRWAAGANPTLNFVLQQFEEASSYRKAVIVEETKRFSEVVSLCQGILHFEALRTRTPEAISSDNNFLTLINRCNECCMLMESTSSTVSDLEIQLMSIKSPAKGESIDKSWLNNILTKISVDIADMENKTTQINNELDKHRSTIQEKVSNIKTILTAHHKLMSDIRTILKSMAKQEEQDFGDEIVPDGIRDYLALYKSFSENVTTALKSVLTEEVVKETMLEALDMLRDIMKQIPQIYNNLIEFAPPLLTTSEEPDVNNAHNDFVQSLKGPSERESSSPARKISSLHRELTTGTPPNSPQTGTGFKGQSTPAKKEKVSRDPRTGKAVQERNTYAVGVWRRVKMKLDGRDPDLNKRMSVAEQVDYVIKDASHLDNLAVLYEGWTPWV
ncbi:serine/threonine-protein kinase SMG1-like [Gigantopelta aegis]|uniref:serine/threonine-protein kinase SMG1-like n=1 Tax=Gigantopelta aegis TaxID=1735272 RepID=UPI001B88A8F7|nr:serine/threonine-protein kinase SMG1-like [Gigantopelta aegis]